MADYINSGTLWLEKDPKTDRSPNFTGDAQLECPSCSYHFEKRLAGWNKTTKTGKDLISIKLDEPRESQPKQDNTPTDQEVDDNDILSQIPF